MPFEQIVLKPGINTTYTPLLNTGGYSAGSLIRWKDGLPEKNGGWTNISPTPFAGTAVRGLHSWSDLTSNLYLAAGTDQRLQLLFANTIFDITPVRSTINAQNLFSTTLNSTSVELTRNAHGALVGDWINIVIPVAIGGIVVFGYYQVATVPDVNNLTFVAASAATSTVNASGTVPSFASTAGSGSLAVTLTKHGYSVGQIFNVQVSTTVDNITLSGGYLVQSITNLNVFVITQAVVANNNVSIAENAGNAQVQFLLGSGPSSAFLSAGYGTGGYGLGGYGQGQGGNLYVTPLRQWALDNFGQNLIAAPTNGTIYQWVPPTATGNIAAALSNAPSAVAWCFVTMPQQQIMALGAATSGGSQDPMLVRYSDIAQQTVWTATATNQAGSFRLSTGSMIVGGGQVAQQTFVWTDLGLWTAQYIGFPYVYQWTEVARGCGLVAPRAWCTLNQMVVWLSNNKINIYGANGVQQLPCAVWDNLFQNLNTLQAGKICVCPNADFNEITIYYPSASGSGENDSWVRVQIDTNQWDYGTDTSFVSTAWIDRSSFGGPIGADLSLNAQQHESGNNANASAMHSWVETGYIQIARGTEFIAIDQIIPDFIMSNGSVLTMRIYARDWPGGQVRTYGPYTITPTTRFIPNLRIRARQIAFRVDSQQLGAFFRFGAPSYRGAPDGRL